MSVWEQAEGGGEPERKEVKRLVRSVGFDALGLQFAIDYAYFLKRTGKSKESLALLKEPLLLMDRDRNPNLPSIDECPPEGFADRHPEISWPFPAGSRMRFSWGVSAGISRKEFIRLAFGAFSASGKEADLVSAIDKQVTRGRNAARRILARIRMHQGKVDGFLNLELAYIEHGGFDELSASCRRGLVFEDCGRPAEAVTAFEKALELPFKPPDLPDHDEEDVQVQMIRQADLPPPFAIAPTGERDFRSGILDRLIRLYSALGRTDELLQASLGRYELDSTFLCQLDTLECARRRFRASGKEQVFLDWATRQMKETDELPARATLAWLLGDHGVAAKTLAKWAAGSEGESRNPWRLGAWKNRFSEAGRDKLRLLLEAVVKADPGDAQSRLELLDLQDRWEPKEVIPVLETLLGKNASHVFAQGKGVHNRTRFRNYFDLAYRLMRLYEKTGGIEKLVALGMRVLDGKPPFKRTEDNAILPTPRTNWNSRTPVEDILDCVYVMLLHLECPEDIRRVVALADACKCIPLKNQVAKLVPERRGRRIDPCPWRRYGGVTVRTLGLPDGVLVLTNRDDVRAFSPDGRWIGTSWGLVRYRTGEDGCLDVLQVPIGARVTAILNTPAGFFIGTHGGLFRLELPNADQPSVVRIQIEDVFTKMRNRRAARIDQLLWWKDRLWILDDDHAIQLDPVTKEATDLGRRLGRLFTGMGRLWSGQSVFNEKAGEFEPLRCDDRYTHWQCIGATSREVWADVYVNNDLRHRPALVDLQTLEVRPLSISNAPRGRDLCISGIFMVLTEKENRVWLQGDSSSLTYDRTNGVLSLHGSIWEGGRERHVGPAVWRADSGRLWRYHPESNTREEIPIPELDGDRGPKLALKAFPDGKILLGAAIIREWSEDNLGFDDNNGMSHHVQDIEGGLFEIDTETHRCEKLGSPSQELSDFYVKRIFFDDGAKRAYVCTNGGVTVLSLPDARPVCRITVSDGLPSNKVEDVVRIGENLYFACELGDDRGGLAVMDVRSGQVHSLFMADGLESDKVRRLRADGSKLNIIYGTVYERGGRHELGGRCVAPWMNTSVVTFKSSILDTETGKISEGNEVLRGPAPPNEETKVPFLGGAVLTDVWRGGKRFIGGTHGLIVADKDVPLEYGDEIPYRTEQVVPVLTLGQRQRKAAEGVQIARAISLDQLEVFLADENPFVRAEALASLSRGALTDYISAIGKAVKDPSFRVRATAVKLLSQARGDDALEPLRSALEDPKFPLRACAAVALAKRGHVHDLALFERILDSLRYPFDLPFGARSSMSFHIDRMSVHEALAPNADAEVFALLLKHPIATDDYEPRQKILATLGGTLAKRPDAARILLRAYNPHSHSGHVRFARAVFGYAGPSLLPILHRALGSEDRVVRSNAARACGAIGDASSVPRLVKALGLESGLSRASIVWALGELKATETIPDLVKLYLDARNDEKRRGGAGFRMGQSSAATGANYDSIRDLDAVGADWDELKAAARPRPVDPLANEELLSTDLLLEAVRKIGPAAAQDFYRTLAGEESLEGRLESARHLVLGGPEDMKKNLPILRNLFGDRHHLVCISAAVSLLILGKSYAEKSLLAWLDSRRYWERRTVLRELLRVQDAAKLAFAHERIAAASREGGPHDEIRRVAKKLLERMGK